MRIVMDDGSIKDLSLDSAVILDILDILKINPEEVIVAKNGKIVSECDSAEMCDELKVVRIIHGG